MLPLKKRFLEINQLVESLTIHAEFIGPFRQG